MTNTKHKKNFVQLIIEIKTIW